MANPPTQSKPTASPKKAKLAKAAAGPVPGSPAYQAQQEIDPIIAAIKAAAASEAGSADKAIEGLTNSYAKGIAGIDYGSPYSGAEEQQAAVDNALRQSASGQGSSLAAALSQRLQALQGSSGASAVNQEAAALANQGAGIGNADLAGGSAELGQLISDAAAAKSYGQKMPGVVRSAGLQGISQAQGQAEQAINQGTLQAESDLPNIVQQIKADRQATKAAKAQAAYQNEEIQAKDAALNLTARKDSASIQQGNARLAIEQQNANTSAERAAQEALNSNRSYKLALGRLGVSQQSLQLRMATAQAKLKSGGYTPDELRKMQLTANQIATEAAHKNASLQQIMHTMALNDIPLSVSLKAAKLAGYKPGKIGMLSGLEKALARPLAAMGGMVAQAGANAIVKLAQEYKGTPYVWGGESPKGFDCSGFAQYIYGKVGINIPRTTYTQWTAKNGRAVAKSALVPGDLVFFKGSDSKGGLPGHVGIYIGNGKMIDAPHTGADVRVENVFSFGGYMGARRYGKG